MSIAEVPPSHIEQAHRQVEQALQTADQQIEALKAHVTKKNVQLFVTKLRLEDLREDLQDRAISQRHHPSSLPDTQSSEQTGRFLYSRRVLRTQVAPQGFNILAPVKIYLLRPPHCCNHSMYT